MQARLARIQYGHELGCGGGGRLVIEAVFEEMAVKQEVFRQLERIAAPHAVLATNTSTLDVDAIGSVTSRPQDVVGLHFFSPANVMRLLEIVRGRKHVAGDRRPSVGDCQAARKDRRSSRQLRGLHRQSHAARPIMREAEVSCSRKARQPQQVDRVISRRSASPMGPFAMQRLGRARRRLADPQRQARDRAAHRPLFARRRRTLRRPAVSVRRPARATIATVTATASRSPIRKSSISSTGWRASTESSSA